MEELVPAPGHRLRQEGRWELCHGLFGVVPRGLEACRELRQGLLGAVRGGLSGAAPGGFLRTALGDLPIAWINFETKTVGLGFASKGCRELCQEVHAGHWLGFFRTAVTAAFAAAGFLIGLSIGLPALLSRVSRLWYACRQDVLLTLKFTCWL